MDALHQARRGGLGARARRAGRCSARCSSISRRSGASPTRASGRSRGRRRHFTYSKVMAWVAFDRAVKSAEQFGLDGPVDALARRCASEIHAEVCARGFDAELGTLRAGLRLARSSTPACCCCRWSASCRRERSARRSAPSRRSSAAAASTGFVLRYDTARDRGRPAARRGRVPRLQLLARRRLCPARPPRRGAALFERAAGACATTSACWPRSTTRPRGRQVGNFPQAFSHLALVDTAMNLARAAKPAEQRSHQPAAAKGAESD